MIGTLLGNRYEILEKIGEGGMAEVYKAKCHLLNRFVAVKVLKEEYSRDREFVDKFKAEAASAGSLSHNNIVNIYDVGSQNGVNYIVMEYVQGRTLKELIIYSGRLDYNRALDIAIQISKAIECAHKNNIIHRDIKPQNILVTDDGSVKVTDFGIAKASNSVTITNTNKVLGSAHYFSPEQAKGSYVDARTDVYSLGVVLYEMVTGRVPYDAESPVSIALKHLQEPVLPPKHLNNNIPEGLNNIILKAMEKEPILRYQSVRDMLLDLQRIKNNSEYKVELGDQVSEHTKVMSPVTNYENKEEDNTKVNKKKLALILIPLFIFLAVIGFFAGRLLGGGKSGLENNKLVEVPNIMGFTEAEAKREIEAKNLKFRVEARVKSDSPEGTVFKVDPQQGSKVEPQSEVKVSISTGSDKPIILNVVELDVKQAKKILENSGFQVAPIEYQYSDTVPQDIVISQNPEADTPADPNTKVVLYVSKGPENKYTTVPRLIDRSLTEAENLLKSVNLQLGKKIEKETEDKAQDGKIIDQNIKENTANIKEGTAVDVTYYKYVAPKKVAVPTFTGLTYDEAKKLAEDNGLKISPSTKVEGKVADYSPKNQEVDKGTTITLTFEVPEKPAETTAPPKEPGA